MTHIHVQVKFVAHLIKIFFNRDNVHLFACRRSVCGQKRRLHGSMVSECAHKPGGCMMTAIAWKTSSPFSSFLRCVRMEAQEKPRLFICDHTCKVGEDA